MVLHTPIFFTRNQQKHKHHQAESSYISKIDYLYIILGIIFGSTESTFDIIKLHGPPKAAHLKATSPNQCSSSLQAWLGEGRTCLRPLDHKQPPADLRAHIHNTKIRWHGWKARSPAWLSTRIDVSFSWTSIDFKLWIWIPKHSCLLWDVPFLSRLKVITQLAARCC